MKEQLLNEMMVVLQPYLQGVEASDVKLRFSLILKDYDISAAERAVTVWNGDENEIILKRFLAAKIAKGCSEQTIKYYRTEIQKALLRIGKRYDEITADDIRLRMAERVYKEGASKTTANNEYRALSSFYGWLQTEEILLKNPMLKVDMMKEAKKKKEAFTDMDIERIRGACETHRERFMIELLLSTWCRVGEIVNISIEDIKGNELIVHGKGDKYRKVFLNAKAILAMERYLHERKDSNPYLFPKMDRTAFGTKSTNVNKKMWYANKKNVDPDLPMDKSSFESVIRRIGKRAGVKNTHPHRFRRTGATFALRHGMQLTTVSNMLGHRSIETTQIYLDISDEELQAAHRKFVI